MARPRKKWSDSTGQYGATVRIYEDKLGGLLRWDYREGGQRVRPEVDPPMRVRRDAKSDVVPELVTRARHALEQKAARLALKEQRNEQKPEQLTVAGAYALYFDPRKRALPRGKSSLTLHKLARAFWTEELGAATPWDHIAPADVWGALERVREAGHIPTAEKHYNNLRTLYRWLVDRMGYEHLRNPLRTLDKAKLTEGHTPQRPRYTVEEVERMVAVSPQFGERFALFVAFLADSGARGIQVRVAWRSMLDAELQPPPPPGWGKPHGWIVLPAVKGQKPMLTLLTARQRAAVDRALATYLAPWEAEWQESRKDYPLLPSDRGSDRGPRPLVRRPISDTALRRTWAKMETASKVPPRDRLAFHGIRRSWSDDVNQKAGFDAMASAGGWSDRRTPEKIYLSVDYEGIESARKARESE